MKKAIPAVSWLFLALGVIVFFGGLPIPGAILVGASLIAVSIAQLQPPGQPPPESRD